MFIMLYSEEHSCFLTVYLLTSPFFLVSLLLGTFQKGDSSRKANLSINTDLVTWTNTCHIPWTFFKWWCPCWPYTDWNTLAFDFKPVIPVVLWSDNRSFSTFVLTLGHALKYKDSHFKINKLSQVILYRYAESLCAVSPSFPSFSFDLSDPRWTRQQTPLVTMSVVHPVDPQWKVLVTLCDPISELKIWTFYNLIDQVSYLASTGLSIVPYNGKDQQHRKEHKNKDGFQPAKNKQI